VSSSPNEKRTARGTKGHSTIDNSQDIYLLHVPDIVKNVAGGHETEMNFDKLHYQSSESDLTIDFDIGPDNYPNVITFLMELRLRDCIEFIRSSGRRRCPYCHL
jgi:hypothetical protein